MDKEKNNLTERLLKIKGKIEDSKQKKAQLEGKLSALKDRLRKEFECETIEQAETKASELEKQIEKSETEIEGRITELEKQLSRNGASSV